MSVKRERNERFTKVEKFMILIFILYNVWQLDVR